MLFHVPLESRNERNLGVADLADERPLPALSAHRRSGPARTETFLLCICGEN